MQKPNQTVNMVIRVTADMYNSLKQYADNNYTTRSEVVRQLVGKLLKIDHSLHKNINVIDGQND